MVGTCGGRRIMCCSTMSFLFSVSGSKSRGGVPARMDGNPAVGVAGGGACLATGAGRTAFRSGG